MTVPALETFTLQLIQRAAAKAPTVGRAQMLRRDWLDVLGHRALRGAPAEEVREALSWIARLAAVEFVANPGEPVDIGAGAAPLTGDLVPSDQGCPGWFSAYSAAVASGSADADALGKVAWSRFRADREDAFWRDVQVFTGSGDPAALDRALAGIDDARFADAPAKLIYRTTLEAWRDVALGASAAWDPALAAHRALWGSEVHLMLLGAAHLARQAGADVPEGPNLPRLQMAPRGQAAIAALTARALPQSWPWLTQLHAARVLRLPGAVSRLMLDLPSGPPVLAAMAAFHEMQWTGWRWDRALLDALRLATAEDPYTLFAVVPEIEAWHALALGDLDRALRKGVDLHREAFGDEVPALHLAAVAAAAVDAGTPPRLTDPLLLPDLVAGSAQDWVVGCPLCAMPVHGGEERCDVCEADLSADAPLEMSPAEARGRTHVCPQCRGPRHPLAVICPRCRHRQG